MSAVACVSDASALLALLRGEEGAGVTDAALRDPGNACYVHALNLTEVFYDRRRADGEEAAQIALETLQNLGIQAREDLDAAFWQDAGRIKADYRRVSLADCCGVALTRRVGGTFVTTDHHELDPLEAAGVCPIRFIR